MSSPSISPQLHRLGAKRHVLVFGTLFVTLLLSVAGATIVVQRQQAIEEWRANLATLSRLLAEHAHQSIKAADLVQRSIAERVAQLGVANDGELRRSLGNRTTFDMLNDKISGVPQIDVATIVAANGEVVNFSRSFPPPSINLSDRDYVEAHQRDRGLLFFLSQPVKNRGNGRWTFYLTRKIKSLAGEMIGLTLVGIESSFFGDYYQAVNFSEFSAISLYRADGALLARVPAREESMGKILGEQPALRALREGRETVVTNEPRLVDGADSRLRIVAARAVPEYPLVVVVTATEELILGAWRQRATLIGGAAGGVAIIFVGLLAWIVRLLNRREEAMAKLRRSESELERDAQLLTQKNQELEQFSYVASHDLRQPLRMISSYLGLIERRLGPDLGGEIKDFLDFAVGGARRMDRLILDLLEYSRTGKSTQRVPVSLGQAVADARANLTVAMREADAEIIVADDLPTVSGDPTDLTRLFQNLIGNAVKYRAPDRRPRVVISCRRLDGEWLVSVMDNGIGIAEEDRERAFAIFQRLVPQEAYEGTGIGLAVCKKIVEHHGGRIWIESAPDGGSIFNVTIASQ